MHEDLISRSVTAKTLRSHKTERHGRESWVLCYPETSDVLTVDESLLLQTDVDAVSLLLQTAVDAASLLLQTDVDAVTLLLQTDVDATSLLLQTRGGCWAPPLLTRGQSDQSHFHCCCLFPPYS